MGPVLRTSAGNSVLVLSAGDVESALPRLVAIESQRAAYRSVSSGAAVLHTAAYGTAGPAGSLVFALTGMIAGSTGLAGKVGIQLPDNPSHGLPSIHAVVVIFDPDTGAPLAFLNGNALTTLRTSAGLAVAADALSPSSARTLGVLGSGPQAVASVRMIAEVRSLDRVLLWSPSPARRNDAVATLAPDYDFPVMAVDSPRKAVTGSEVVTACTRSSEPVVLGDWLSPGQTVLTIGSYAPDRREIDLAATNRARTFVDLFSTSRQLCGPILEAIAAGTLADSDIVEIGAVLADPRLGRSTPEQIIVFHSLGFGAQDATAGWAAYQRALQLSLGQRAVL